MLAFGFGLAARVAVLVVRHVWDAPLHGSFVRITESPVDDRLREGCVSRTRAIR